MEQSFANHQDLLAILTASLMSPQLTSNVTHPIIEATLKSWRTLLSRNTHTENFYKLDIPVKTYEWLIEGFDTKDCRKRGINFLQSLRQSNLPSDTYRSLQISHFHSATKCKETLDIPNYIWKFLQGRSNKSTREIYFFYNTLTGPMLLTKTPDMCKWEKFLMREFSLQQWLKSIQMSFRISSCVEHWENFQKMYHSWYMTPYRMSKIFKDSMNKCWRLCNQIVNLYHVFWNCPHITPFWENVASLISEITGQYKTLTPELALLNIGLDSYQSIVRTVIAHVLFAARTALASKWKSPVLPTRREITTRVNIQYQYEKILAFKKFKAPQFMKVWQAWFHHPEAAKDL